MFEYPSVSKTKMFTFCPLCKIWSNPPYPMSYAQPSPPIIQTDLSTIEPIKLSAIFAFGFFIFDNFACKDFSFSRCLKTSFSSNIFSTFGTFNSNNKLFNASFFWFKAIRIPKPYSALSSNKELDQAGPRPAAFLVHGVVGKFAP